MKLTKKEAAQLALHLNLDDHGNSSSRGTTGGMRKNHRTRKQPAGLFEQLCEAHGLPVPVAEYVFAPPRRWRFDWLFEGWLALEIEGVGPAGSEGRHQRIAGWLKDMEKYREAVILGFAIIRVTTREVDDGSAFEIIHRALASREEQP